MHALITVLSLSLSPSLLMQSVCALHMQIPSMGDRLLDEKELLTIADWASR